VFEDTKGVIGSRKIETVQSKQWQNERSKDYLQTTSQYTDKDR